MLFLLSFPLIGRVPESQVKEVDSGSFFRPNA